MLPLSGHPDKNSVTDADPQYSLLKILTIWALVAVPMPVMAFIVAPAITTPGTFKAGLVVWYLMITGMVWQVILSVILLNQMLDEFSWPMINARI